MNHRKSPFDWQPRILPLLFLALTVIPRVSLAQGAVEVTDMHSADEQPEKTERTVTFKPEVGRKAAEKYMAPKGGREASGTPVQSRAVASSRGDHYLALHVGGYISDNSYKWGGSEKSENVGKLNSGVTYRVGEWVNSMDLFVRIDFSTFALNEGRATKLSFLPIVAFPDSNSRFPLYFGGGIGPGVFVNQISSESSLSLDYQLLGGARFFDLIGNAGFFFEAGLKNHLFLLSDGQFNGTFATAGSVFTF